MVRSHIGNVVCRKALCVRVASSPPKASAKADAFLFSVTHGINFHGKRRLQVYEFFYGFLAFQQLMYYNKKIDTADGHKPETPL